MREKSQETTKRGQGITSHIRTDVRDVRTEHMIDEKERKSFDSAQ
jgi:hypothetical protein